MAGAKAVAKWVGPFFFTSGGVSTQGLASQGGRESEGRAEGEIGIVGILGEKEGDGTDGIGGLAAWHNKEVEAGRPGLGTRETVGTEADGDLGRTG